MAAAGVGAGGNEFSYHQCADTFIIFMGFCCVSHTIDFVAGESEKGWGRVEVVFIVCRGREENY